MKRAPRDESADPGRRLDEDLRESKEPAQPASIGPAVAGPVVAAGMPPTGEAVVGAEPPSENELASEAELALEREAKKTGAHHTR